MCPNKNTQEWKDLVDAFGEDAAGIAFFRNKTGEIPTISEAENMLGKKAGDKTQMAATYSEWVATKDLTRDNFKNTMEKLSEKSIETFKNIARATVKSFDPKRIGELSIGDKVKSILRSRMGEKTAVDRIADNNAKSAMDFWLYKSHNDCLHFINSIENPAKYIIDSPGLKLLRETYIKRLDAVFETLHSIKDLPYREDYFPHFWKSPNSKNSVEYFNKISGKPFEGNKSFLKQRFFEDIQAGLDAGLELVTYNPEEMVRIAEMNSTRFKMTHDVFNDMKDSGLLQYVRGSGKAREGYTLVDDPLFKRMMPYAIEPTEEEVQASEETGTEAKAKAGLSMGGWYMPQEAADVINNHLSRGIINKPYIGRVYGAAMFTNNLYNLFQLGISPFHFAITSMHAAAERTGLGISQILTLDPKKWASGALDVAKGISIVPTIYENYKSYNNIKQNYFAGNQTPELLSLINANAKIQGAKEWQINAEYNFKKAIAQVKQGGWTGAKSALPAAWHALLIVPEITAKPIMEYHVPAMKVGSALKMMKTELELRPDMTQEEYSKMVEKAWDTQDDMLGQVCSDNVFMNKMVKDLGYVTFRSFGYTGGTVRAGYHALTDIPESTARLVSNKGLSPRTANLIGLAVNVGIMGGLTHYMMTGKRPEELKDYYFPKDGTKNLDGTDRRIAFTTYLIDFRNYIKEPKNTFIGKTSPFISEFVSIFGNKDFYGNEIYDQEDPMYKKGLDVLNYELKELIPLSMRQEPGPEPESTKIGPINAKIDMSKKGVEKLFAIKTAPADVMYNDMENTINDRLKYEMDKFRKSKGYDPNQSAWKKVIMHDVEEGKSISELSREDMKKAGLADAEGKYISVGKIKNLVKDAKLTIAEKKFKYLTPEGQLNIISKLKPEEVDLLLKRKAAVLHSAKEFINLKRTNPEIFAKHPEYIKSWDILWPMYPYKQPEYKEEVDTELDIAPSIGQEKMQEQNN